MTQSGPAVSVVIPTFNRGGVVGEAIDSVLAQSAGPVEVIVVDDGSTDNTQDVLRRYGDRIRVIEQPNRERGAARNTGLREATAEYVSFLDADDLWLPHKVATDLAVFAAHPAAGVVHSLVWLADAAGRRYARQRSSPPSGWVHQYLLVRNIVSFCTAVVRRDALERVGGFCEDRALSGSEDWELWTRMSAQYEFWFHPALTAVYRELPDGTLRDPVRMRSALARAIELIYDDPVQPAVATPKRRATAVAGATLLLAKQMVASGDRAGAWWHLRACLRSRPGWLVDVGVLRTAVLFALPAPVVAALRAAKRHFLYRAMARRDPELVGTGVSLL